MKLELTNIKSWRKSTFEFSDSACTLISGPSGQGKCFARGTPIRLFVGGVKPVEDITRDDIVMGWDGTPRQVLSTTSGQEQLFRIVGFSPTGKRVMQYTVNGSHTLTLLFLDRPVDINLSEYLSTVPTGLDFRGFRAEIEYPETPVILPPYLYGVVIHGGINTVPLQLKRAMNRELQRVYGCYFGVNGNLKQVFGRRFRRVQPISTFFEKIRALAPNMSQILKQYRHNTVEIRKQVLAGLVDRHGTVTGDGEIVLNVTKNLANTLTDLVQSLGGYCYAEIGTLTIGLISSIPTRFLRGYRVFPRGLKIRVEPVNPGQYYGFMLSGDGRFCLGDYTVTHNSSILQGIEFALFGTGKNLITNGETSCTAKLTVGDAVITRTKRPNRLVIQTSNGELEDDAAQAWISRRFSAKSSITPFITMTPAEKLAFLEHAAFRNIDIAKLKELAKNRVKTREISLAKAQQQLQTTQAFLDACLSPGSPPEGYDSLEIKDLRKLEKRLKNSRVMVTKIHRSLEHYRGLLEKTAEARKEKSLLETRRDSIVEELNTTPEIDVSEIRVKLAMKKQELTKADEYEEFLRVSRRREELENELKMLRETHEKITEELTTAITEGKEAETPFQKITAELDKLSEYSALVERIEELESVISSKSKIEEELRGIPARREALLQSETVQVTCPCCDANLGYSNGALTEITVDSIDTDDTINSLKKLETKLNRKLAKIEEAESQLDKLNETAEALETGLISEEKEAEYIELLPNLETKIAAGKTAETKRNIEQAKYDSNHDRITAELGKLTVPNPPEIPARDHDEITEEIEQINTELQAAISESSHRAAKTKELATVEKRLGQIEIPDTTAEYTEKLQKLGEDLPEYEQKVEEYSNAVEIMREFTEYQRVVDEYNTRLETVSEARQRLEEEETGYSVAVSFRQKIVDAETVTLASVINTLNSYASDYLQAFFPDNPITVEILPYKETAKRGGTTRKSQISTRVEYRGTETDINSLSSGERDRVILAFSLAVNQLQSGRIIMLDECTSSLDAETSNTVFSKIRENLQDRCVLIVAHQIVQGIFDDVLEI